MITVSIGAVAVSCIGWLGLWTPATDASLPMWSRILWVALFTAWLVVLAMWLQAIAALLFRRKP